MLKVFMIGRIILLTIPLCVAEFVLAKKYADEVALILPIVVLALSLDIGFLGLIESGILFFLFYLVRRNG